MRTLRVVPAQPASEHREAPRICDVRYSMTFFAQSTRKEDSVEAEKRLGETALLVTGPSRIACSLDRCSQRSRISFKYNVQGSCV